MEPQSFGVKALLHTSTAAIKCLWGYKLIKAHFYSKR